jgi:hypothetical protein
MSAVVAFSALGTKRTRSVLRRSNAESSATVPTASQLLPLLIEYCHVPLPLVSDVMAIPSTAPLSTSVMRSPPAEAMMLATVCPALLTSSSVIVVRVMSPVLSSTGASLTLVTVIEAVARLLE